MKFNVGVAADGGHTVVREMDGKPILRSSHSLRFVQQMCDVLNSAGAEVEAIGPRPDFALAYVDPERMRREVEKHSEAMERITNTIMAAYQAQGVARIHV